MGERLVGLAPFPAYLDQVERLVGLPLYSDASAEALVRSDPAQLEREGFQFRHEIYLLIQYAIAGGENQDSLTEDRLGDAWRHAARNETEVRWSSRETIRHARGELMEADVGLKTSQVKRLEAALAELPAQQPPEQLRRSRRSVSAPNYDVLPAHMTTLRSVDQLIGASHTTAYNTLRYGALDSTFMHLPASNRPEHTVSWAIVRQLAQRFGLLEGVDIDFGMLPEGAEDTNPIRLAYARGLQRRIIPVYKLTNIPGLVQKDEMAAMRTVARPYEVTLTQLERLLEGGYHFLEEYVVAHGIKRVCRLNRATRKVAEFLAKEEAAAAWEAYLAIPRAGTGDVALVQIARNAGVARSLVDYSLSSDERAAVQSLRARSPRGRVLEHLPKAYAEPLQERLSRRTLPVYRVPVNRLSQYLQTGYSANMKWIADMGVHVPKLLLSGEGRRQSCCDWRAVRCLELLVGRKPEAPEIDYEKLPANASDTTPEHLAYARTVLSRFGVEAATAPGVAGILSGVENYPDYTELDAIVQREVREMAQATRFTPEAIIRLLLERGYNLNFGCSDDCLPQLARLRAPSDAVGLAEAAHEAGMEIIQARDFLRRYRGQFSLKLDQYGYPDIFLNSLSQEMLLRQKFPAGKSNPGQDVQAASSEWLHVGQILPQVNASTGEFYRWCSQQTETVASRWLHIRREGPVLLHYPRGTAARFIAEKKRENRGGTSSH